MSLREASLEASCPVVVQFHATWCAPCRALAPHLSRLEEAYRGKVEVRRVDLDKEPEAAREFGVRGMQRKFRFLLDVGSV